MKASIYICVATILYVSVATEATRCHECGYISGVPEEFIEEPLKSILDVSCKLGNTPNDKFLKTCDVIPGFEKNELGCATGSFKGTLPKIGVNQEAELILRGCFPLLDGTVDTCEAYTKSQLIRIPNLPEELIAALKQLPDDFTAEICVAKGIENNNNNAGSFIKINVALLIVSVLCFVSKLL